MDDAQGGRRVNVQVKACIHLLGEGINRLAYAETSAKSRDEISFAYLLTAPYNQRIYMRVKKLIVWSAVC